MAGRAGAAPAQKLRIATLHGFLQNSAILHQKLGALRKATKWAQWEHLDGPIDVWSVPQLRELDWIADKVRELRPDMGAGPASDTTDPAKSLRTWYTMHKRGGEAEDWPATLEYLLAELAAREPPHVLLGFSQGAATAAALASFLCSPNPAHVAAVEAAGCAQHAATLRGVVLIGGFCRPGVPIEAPIPERIASLHIAGKADTIIPESDSATLSESFSADAVWRGEAETGEEDLAAAATAASPAATKWLYTHVGGHAIPMHKQARHVLVAFLRAVRDSAAL